MNLLRTRKTEAASQVEAYHDRIQEVVQSSLDANALRQAIIILRLSMSDQSSRTLESSLRIFWAAACR